MISSPQHVQVDHPGATVMNPSPVYHHHHDYDDNNNYTNNLLSTPWCIGSTTVTTTTSGRNNVVRHQQQQQAERPSAGAAAVANQVGGVVNTTKQQQQQEGSSGTTTSVPATTTTTTTAGGGAAIGDSGEAKTATTPPTTTTPTTTLYKSHYHDKLLEQPPAPAVESVLAATCDAMGFDIAELWLRTGPKTHQLTNSHLRPTALEESVRKELMDVYYGEKSNERTHRLSPALCKRAKESQDVVWVTATTQHDTTTTSIGGTTTTSTTTTTTTLLRNSISDVRTAVAIPVSHGPSNTNLTVMFFSIRRIIMKPPAVEFLVHMALAAGVASVNTLSDSPTTTTTTRVTVREGGGTHQQQQHLLPGQNIASHSEHIPSSKSMMQVRPIVSSSQQQQHRISLQKVVSVTGARLDLQWRQLLRVEYLTDGGNSWIHTAMLDGKPVVVKTLKPECQDVALAMAEIESELEVHSKLNHPNIVGLMGAGITTKGVRFMVLERLDGGTLTQMLGYDTRIRDRRKRFWRRKQFAYVNVLKCARSIASAMAYLHDDAITGSMVLHRDLKPDNIGFELNGSVKLIDFGLAKIITNAVTASDDVYEMSGETGSLRYMAPEVASSLPYNHKADVYSFGIILWELNTCKKPFEGLTRDVFYERVVRGGERPPINKKWPDELKCLILECWNADYLNRPNFSDITERLDNMLAKEKGGLGGLGGGGTTTSSTTTTNTTSTASTMNTRRPFRKLTGMIDRHSTWF